MLDMFMAAFKNIFKNQNHMHLLPVTIFFSLYSDYIFKEGISGKGQT